MTDGALRNINVRLNEKSISTVASAPLASASRSWIVSTVPSIQWGTSAPFSSRRSVRMPPVISTSMLRRAVGAWRFCRR